MPQDQKFNDIVLALAGIFQAAVLVKIFAETGQVNETAYLASVNSLFKIDAPDVPSVFDGKAGLLTGLQELKMWCDKTVNYKNMDVNRYVYSLMFLERKCSKDKSKNEQLTRRIKQAVSQANYFTTTHPTVSASLASIYVDIFGTYNYRIQVIGSAELLRKPEMANKVRALLLAGIRATVLWRQLGGGRLQLLFMRHKILDAVTNLISSINANQSMSINNANS